MTKYLTEQERNDLAKLEVYRKARWFKKRANVGKRRDKKRAELAKKDAVGRKWTTSTRFGINDYGPRAGGTIRDVGVIKPRKG